MKNKKINTRDLVEKIEKLTKSRIAEQSVVPLDAFRDAKKKAETKVILVIEDDETMRGAIKRILEGDSYRTKMAADASELSAILSDEPIDLILLDVGLPWVNGFELAQMLKENRDLKSIPLVSISGKSSDEEIKKAFSLGADDFIKKPFDIEAFRKTIAALLKLKSTKP